MHRLKKKIMQLLHYIHDLKYYVRKTKRETFLLISVLIYAYGSSTLSWAHTSAVCLGLLVCLVVNDREDGVVTLHVPVGVFKNTLSYFSFQPVLHDWCNKGRGMCYPVCGMVHTKEPLLLIGKSSIFGSSGFPLAI